jgi:hypothetical protein
MPKNKVHDYFTQQDKLISKYLRNLALGVQKTMSDGSDLGLELSLSMVRHTPMLWKFLPQPVQLRLISAMESEVVYYKKRVNGADLTTVGGILTTTKTSTKA